MTKEEYEKMRDKYLKMNEELVDVACAYINKFFPECKPDLYYVELDYQGLDVVVIDIDWDKLKLQFMIKPEGVLKGINNNFEVVKDDIQFVEVISKDF